MFYGLRDDDFLRLKLYALHESELLMRLKQSYRKDAAETEVAIIKDHRRPSLLVIDEFARRGETDWENNVLFELLNQRYADMTDT
jgi:DNA replication protein DnaC